MSSKIIEKILEPSKIHVGSKFLLKIKVQDEYNIISSIVTEDGKKLITEDGKSLRTEWGELNG